jgi:hypothetical protein
MSTTTIDASNPSATVNLPVLKSALNRLLEADRRNGSVLGPDEYMLLWALANGPTDGATAGTVTSIAITY